MTERSPSAVAGRRRRLWRLGLLAATVVIWAQLARAAAAEAHAPLSPVFLGASYAYEGLQIEPKSITYTGDGTGRLGGPHARDQNSGIAWTRWGSSGALGTGFNQLDDCNPDCAGGHFSVYPVRIELWQPRKLGGILVFTRLTIFYTHGRPPGESRTHYTFTDTYKHGYGFSWGPPDVETYCVNTFGQPPAPGCANINSLP